MKAGVNNAGIERSSACQWGIRSRSTEKAPHLLTKIELLAGVFLGFLVIGLGGGELGGMSAEVETFTVQVNISRPLLILLLPGNTPVLRRSAT